MDYEFTLTYQLDPHDCDQAEIVERMGAAGCTDALVGIGKVGRLALHFTRQAGSAREAVCTALRDLQAIIPGARLVEASPDLVGLTDIAEQLGVSRQNMRKLMLAHDADFPLPVHEGTSSLWHLCEVLDWLHARGTYQIGLPLREMAWANFAINRAKEARRPGPKMSDCFKP